MSDTVAKFDTLPGNIIINSLYIPRFGSSHLIMGQANSKQEALKDVLQHLSKIVYAGNAHKSFEDPTNWNPIPNRGEPGVSQDHIKDLPIRSQKGVQLKTYSSTAKIYADDYVTGQIPWTISFSNANSSPLLHEIVHNRIKDYFIKEGNQKFSWRKRYVNV